MDGQVGITIAANAEDAEATILQLIDKLKVLQKTIEELGGSNGFDELGNKLRNISGAELKTLRAELMAIKKELDTLGKSNGLDESKKQINELKTTVADLRKKLTEANESIKNFGKGGAAPLQEMSNLSKAAASNVAQLSRQTVEYRNGLLSLLESMKTMNSQEVARQATAAATGQTLKQLNLELSKAVSAEQVLAAATKAVNIELDKSNNVLLSQTANTQKAANAYAQLKSSIEQSANGIKAFNAEFGRGDAEIKQLEASLKKIANEAINVQKSLDRGKVSTVEATNQFKALSDRSKELNNALKGINDKAVASIASLGRNAELSATAVKKLALEAERLSASKNSFNNLTVSLDSLRKTGALTENQFNELTGVVARLRTELATGGQSAAAYDAAIDKLSSSFNDLTRSTGAGAMKIAAFHASMKDGSANAAQMANNADKAAGGVKNFGNAAGQARTSILNMSTAIQAIAFSAIAQNVVRANTELYSMERAFKSIAGSAGAAKNELAYIRTLAENQGVAVAGLSASWVQMAASAKAAGYEMEGARELFSSATRAMGLLGSSSEQVKRGLNALNQMLSKNKIMSEELYGQLAEALPGASGIFEKALGMTNAEMRNMMANGDAIATDVLPKVAAELNKMAGLDDRIESLGAAIARIGNDLDLMFQKMNETGAITDILNSFRELTRLVGDYANELVLMGKVMLGMKLVSFSKDLLSIGASAATAAKGVSSLAQYAESLGDASGGVDKVTKSMAALQAASMLASSAIAGFGLGTWLRENSELASDFGNSIAKWSTKVMTAIGDIATADFSEFNENQRKINAGFEDGYSAVKRQQQAIQEIKITYDELAQATLDWQKSFTIEGRIEDDLKKMSESFGKLGIDIEKVKLSLSDTSKATEFSTGITAAFEASSKVARELVSEIEKIQDVDLNINSDGFMKSAESIRNITALIDEQLKVIKVSGKEAFSDIKTPESFDEIRLTLTSLIDELTKFKKETQDMGGAFPPELEESLKSYKDMLYEADKAYERLTGSTNDFLVALEDQNDILKDNIDILEESNDARMAIIDSEIALAEARGDTLEVISLEIEKLKEEAAAYERTAEVKRGQLTVEQAILDALNARIAAGDRLTESEKARVVELEKSIIATKAAIEASQNLAKAKQLEASTAETSNATRKATKSTIDETTESIRKQGEETEKARKISKSSILGSNADYKLLGAETKKVFTEMIENWNHVGFASYQAFQQQKQTVQKSVDAFRDLSAEIKGTEQPTLTMIDQWRAAAKAINHVDEQNLNTLIGEIDRVEGKIRSMRQTLTDSVKDLRAELAELEGDAEAGAKRDYERAIEAAQAALEKARASRDAEAIAAAQEILELTKKKYELEKKGREEDRKVEKERETAYSGGSSTPSGGGTTVNYSVNAIDAAGVDQFMRNTVIPTLNEHLRKSS